MCTVSQRDQTTGPAYTVGEGNQRHKKKIPGICFIQRMGTLIIIKKMLPRFTSIVGFKKKIL